VSLDWPRISPVVLFASSASLKSNPTQTPAAKALLAPKSHSRTHFSQKIELVQGIQRQYILLVGCVLGISMRLAQKEIDGQVHELYFMRVDWE